MILLSSQSVLGSALRSIAAAACLAVVLAGPVVGQTHRWQDVAQALGKPGTQMPGGVYRIGLPRSDLKVTLDGVVLRPSLALGSWLGFAPMGNQTMVMGDLVLTEIEISPVMKKLEQGDIQITAIHNHLLRAEPATLYMYIYGQGDAVTLARATRCNCLERDAADGATGRGIDTRPRHGRYRSVDWRRRQDQRRGLPGQHSSRRNGHRKRNACARGSWLLAPP
jgi:hypothetical protein